MRYPPCLHTQLTILSVTAFTLLIFLFVAVRPPVQAAAANNPIFATIQYVNDAISTALSPIQSVIASPQTQQTSQASQISSIKQTLATSHPTDFVFFQSPRDDSNYISPVFDAINYTKLTITFNCTETSNNGLITLQVSTDNANWLQAQQWRDDGSDSQTLSVAARYYRLINNLVGQSTISAYGRFYN